MLKIHLPLPAQIIKGLLSRGEKLQLAGGSKSSKSWALIDLGLCVGAGLPWWGFPTFETPVIFLNMEIPRAFFEERVRKVAAARGISVSNFHVCHLRGGRLYDDVRWDALRDSLEENCRKLPNPLIITDPTYKLMGPKSNELVTGSVHKVMEQLEELIELADGANVSSHHYSKGSQSTKEAIDRGSGSGVFQRDPDTVFPITPHELVACYAVEPYVRNHEAVKPFCIRWMPPVFNRDDSLDPGSLKKPKRSGKSGASSYAVDQALSLISQHETVTRAELVRRIVNAKIKVRSEAYKLVDYLISEDFIKASPTNPKSFQKTGKK